MFQINGAIASHNGKTWFACRTRHLFNYDSESFITLLDDDFEPVSDVPIVAENGNTAFEDIRLLSFEGKLLAFYSYLPFDGEQWKWQFGVGYAEIDPYSGLMSSQISLRNLSRREHEKNWCPYVYNNEVFMVTDFEPNLRIVKLNIGHSEAAFEYFLSSEQTISWGYGEIRGGTPLIASNDSEDSWLYGFVHSHIINEQHQRRRDYYFTFIRFDHSQRRFEYVPEPLPFPEHQVGPDHDLLWEMSVMKKRKVIFPIGVIHHQDGLLVSFGKDDVTSFVEYYTWEYLKGLFKSE